MPRYDIGKSQEDLSVQTVRQERTGWRDEALSQRHRKWGWDCPAVDIDFLMLEYDQGKAKALVEYKHENAKPQDPKHPSYKAMKDLADRAQIPFFAVRYAGDFSWWRVHPLNDYAHKFLPKTCQMTEVGYVTLLYTIRGRPVPGEVVGFTSQRQLPTEADSELQDDAWLEGIKIAPFR